MAEIFVPKVSAIFVLDNDGSRLSAKYYDKKAFPSIAEQNAFEGKLFKKTKHNNARTEAELIMLDQFTIIFRSGTDAHFYVVGDQRENELILTAVLECLHEALSHLLRGHVDRRTILDNLELTMLTIDELVDAGTILETDSQAIVNRVLMRGVTGSQVPLADMTISQAFASAKDQFIKSIANRESY